MTDKLYDIVAFKVPSHHSILYQAWLTEETLKERLSWALGQGANVVSIRLVERDAAKEKSA